MSGPIRVNGNLLSWGSIIAKVNGASYNGITGISYADKRERVKGYGMGRSHAPYGRSSGRYAPDPVKLTMWKDDAQILRAALALLSPDQRSYGNVEFHLTVQYFELERLPIHVDISRCVIVGNTSSDEENPDPLKEELEIDCMQIFRNGLTLFDSTGGLL